MFAHSSFNSTIYLRTDGSRGCSVNYFCCGAFCIFIGSTFLCALGFLVIYPYHLTKNWEKINCTVTDGIINRSLCACGHDITIFPNCLQSFPCLQISIKYKSSAPKNCSLNDTTRMLLKNILKKNINFTSKLSTEYARTFMPVSTAETPLTLPTTVIYEENSEASLTATAKDLKPSQECDSSTAFEEGERLMETDNCRQDVNTALLYRTWSDITYGQVRPSCFTQTLQ